MKAVIIDDEPGSVEIIETLTRSYCPEITIAGSFHSVKNAVARVKELQPEVLFLDVELADGLGFEILEQISDLATRTIFITAYEHYALKAIKHHAFDYILKPIDPQEFGSAMKRAVAALKKEMPLPDNAALLEYLKNHTRQKIAVPVKNGFQYFLVDDIVMIEGDGSYALMHLASAQNLLISRKIKDFETALADKGFLRVHKSYLVNLQHVTALHRDDSGYLVMSNQKKVPISPKDKEEIIAQIKKASDMI